MCNCLPAPVSTKPCMIDSRLRSRRVGVSLRMQSTTAVDEVIGSVILTRATSGKTTASGSRASRPTRKPMVEFQKPTTVQGNVTANNMSRAPAAQMLTSRLKAARSKASIATKLRLASTPNKILLPVSMAGVMGFDDFKIKAFGSLILFQNARAV